jgi:anti-sigma B factor antagonist
MTQSKSPIAQVRRVGEAVVVKVVGDIDLNRSSQFQHALLELLDDSPRRVVVNLRDVPYMDSSGIASLVKLLSRVRKMGASLRLVALSDRTRSLFEITRLDSVFEIYQTEEEALA